MGHGRRSIEDQTRAILGQKRAYGESRHKDKIAGETQNKIYSYNTYETYVQQATRYGKWLEEEKGQHNINNGNNEDYVREYIEQLKAENKSAWSQKTAKAAIAKLYGRSFENVKTEGRHRADITRSRDDNKPNYEHFSNTRNEETIHILKHTGLRRSEAESISPKHNHIENRNGQYFLTNVKGKGGRIRDIPILRNDERTIQYFQEREEGTERYIENIPSALPVHTYRAEYATELYREYKREREQIPTEDRYYMRNDRAGELYDRQALKIVSEALGHTREEVAAGHYIR